MIEEIVPKNEIGAASKLETRNRNSETIRKLAEKINRANHGVTPEWQRVIETYRRVKSETIPADE